jgi:hypothetical protein
MRLRQRATPPAKCARRRCDRRVGEGTLRRVSERRDGDPFTPWTFTPIGVARTVIAEKYSIPRQPGLCPAARGTVHLRRR